MSRKQYANLHAEALERLCFVCGELVTPGCLYSVDKFIDVLCEGLKCESIFSMPGVTPCHFCRKYYSAMKHVATGRTIQTGRAMIDWEECNPTCSTCERLVKRKKK